MKCVYFLWLYDLLRILNTVYRSWMMCASIFRSNLYHKRSFRICHMSSSWGHWFSKCISILFWLLFFRFHFVYRIESLHSFRFMLNMCGKINDLKYYDRSKKKKKETEREIYWKEKRNIWDRFYENANVWIEFYKIWNQSRGMEYWRRYSIMQPQWPGQIELHTREWIKFISKQTGGQRHSPINLQYAPNLWIFIFAITKKQGAIKWNSLFNTKWNAVWCCCSCCCWNGLRYGFFVVWLFYYVPLNKVKFISCICSLDWK